MSEIPGRSLLFVKAVPAEEGGGLLIGCDCGTTTHLHIEADGTLAETCEIAVTCDGCHSVNWFTVGPVSLPVPRDTGTTKENQT